MMRAVLLASFAACCSALFETEYILGEQYVSQSWAWVLADRMALEFERMLWSPNWEVALKGDGYIVESKNVSGPFAASGVRTTRSSAIVNANADDVYNMLISEVGYTVIDPTSNPEDFYEPPMETYPWYFCRGVCTLEAEFATAAIPDIFGGAREFVVLNAKSSKTRTFLSKSILHPARPGGSVYSGQPAPANYTRGLNTFGVKTVPLNSTACTVEIVNWFDLCPPFPAVAMNAVNELQYFGPLFERIKAAMASQ